jgi:hypothetical protein
MHSRRAPHLFVDISAHGFGHLGQAAPVLNALRERLPGLLLTVRSGLPLAALQARLHGHFVHRAGRSDFGFIMRDATRIDLAASAEEYRARHHDWAQHVAAEATFLSALRPDLVLTDVAYLPLAGAAQAGLPALTMCSLNWADLFAYFFASEPWAADIHQQMLAAYNSAACFLRLTPGMPMNALSRVRVMPPVATLATLATDDQDGRHDLRTQLGCPADERLVLIAFGGVKKQLPVERWAKIPGLRWLIPQDWGIVRADMHAIEPLKRIIPDLLCGVDAVLCKPGYGTFTEAACNGTPVLYLRSHDWPEQPFLIDWLQQHARCLEVSASQLDSGDLAPALEVLWQQPVVPRPQPTGIADVVDIIVHQLRAGNRNA